MSNSFLFDIDMTIIDMTLIDRSALNLIRPITVQNFSYLLKMSRKKQGVTRLGWQVHNQPGTKPDKNQQAE